MSGRRYAFADFLPGTAAVYREYDTRGMFDEYKLPNAEKRISRPVTMLAPKTVLQRVYAKPQNAGLPSNTSPNTPPNTPLPPTASTGDKMQLNEHVMALTLGGWIEEESNMRLTAAEMDLVEGGALKTPSEMVIDALKSDMALMQMYYTLLRDNKFDRTNKTLLQNSEDVALRINEALRQPHHFVDLPELPVLARRELAAFLAQLQRLTPPL
jgi:hypothetical protein